VRPVGGNACRECCRSVQRVQAWNNRRFKLFDLLIDQGSAKM